MHRMGKGKDVPESQPILELNPSHPAVQEQPGRSPPTISGEPPLRRAPPRLRAGGV